MLIVPLLLDLVALTGGTLHTQEPGAEPTLGTLLLEDDAISAVVAPDAPLPEGARVVDVSGMHVVPGLIDAMVSFDAGHDSLYVSSGVTLVRDVGGNFESLFASRVRAARDRVPGPDLLTGGVLISGLPIDVAGAVAVTAEDDIDSLTAELLGPSGADFLSLRPNLERDVWKDLVAAATSLGTDAWSPKPYGLTLEEAVDSGLAGLLFLDGLLPAKGSWAVTHPLACKKQVLTLVESDTPLVPFLLGVAARFIGVEGSADLLPEELDAQVKLLAPQYENLWLTDLEVRRQSLGEEELKTGRGALEKQREVLAVAHAEGVRLVPGSGAPNAWMMPGTALHDELDQWVAAGMTPADALRASTQVAAEALGVDDLRGTLAAGKLADVVVVASDPRESLAPLRRPEFVVVRGRVLDRVALDDLLTTLRNEQAAEREKLATPLAIPMPTLPPGELLLSGEVETWSGAARVSGEHYAVVQTPDGELAYCGRIVRPPIVEGEPEEVTEVIQWAQDGRLDRFDLVHVRGADRLHLIGTHAAGKFAVKAFTGSPEQMKYTRRATERIDTISCDSVTSLLLLMHSELTDAFFVMAFDNESEPLITQWSLQAPDAEGVHPVYLREGGEFYFLCAPNGGLVRWDRRFRGNVASSVAVGLETHDGPGQPLPESRVAAIRAAEEEFRALAAEAAAKAGEGASPVTGVEAEPEAGSQAGSGSKAESSGTSGDKGQQGEPVSSESGGASER